MERINDPSTYEFVSLTLLDSVLYKDNIKYRKNDFEKDIKKIKRDIERKENNQYDNPYNNKTAEIDKLNRELNRELNRNKQILNKIDSLELALGDNKNNVASYTYLFSFRASNSFGAKVLNEYFIQTSPPPTFKVINMTDYKYQLFNKRNDLPGYRDMMKPFNEQSVQEIEALLQ